MKILQLFEGRRVAACETLSELPMDGVVWLDFVRERDTGWAEAVTKLSGYVIHERHVADVENHDHPSYYDSTQDYEMLVFRGVASTSNIDELITRPTVFFVFDRLLVTIHDEESVSIPTVRKKLLGKTIRIPKRAVGLMHLVLTAMVDRCLALREPLINKLDAWRNSLLDPDNPFDDWMSVLQHNGYLRRLSMLCDEQHDAIIAWRDETATNFDDNLAVRYTDLTEHIERVMKFAGEQKGEVDTLIQLHFSAVAHRTNDIVRVLTVISAIFLPLTLVAGIFGMNFEYMPELKIHNAYFMALFGMIGLAVGLLFVFRKKHWI